MSGLKSLCEFGRHRRSGSDGRGYLKDAATPVSIQHKKPATRLIEANIARTNTGHCGKGACSGDRDRPFRPKVITDSGDRDHAVTLPIGSA
ncbi:MAG TPA: hypothetical protein VE267_15570 [Bradyrhizobium sp.]|nr:hypothetical protein [Bradyrhizobium sp.]